MQLQISQSGCEISRNCGTNFDICESSGSKFAMNDGHLLNATATTNGFLFVKYQGQSSLEQHFERIRTLFIGRGCETKLVLLSLKSNFHSIL